MRILLLVAVSIMGAAQTPELQMNVIYVCSDGQSFKVLTCDKATGACDFQNYKNGQAFQRGEALRAQLVALLPSKCHLQTAAEAEKDPHRGEIAAKAAPTASNALTVAAKAGGGGFKAGDRIRVLSSGWQDAVVLQVRGNSYYVRLDNGIEVSKSWPIEVRRQGKLTPEDHALGQWDLHEKVQVQVNGRWVEGEIVGQDLNRYTAKLPGENDRTVNIGAESLRASTAQPRAARPAGQAPKAGLTSCPAKYDGRWEHVSGMGGMTVVFRSGNVTVTEGLGGPMPFECWSGDGKISLYKSGSVTPFSYGFDINNDGTFQTPLGAIKKMGR